MAVEASAESADVDTKALFEPPRPLVDKDGTPIVTRLGGGHPAVVDYDADGVNDIVLGCKLGMFGQRGQALLLKNVGSNAQPRFRWPAGTGATIEGQDKV